VLLTVTFVGAVSRTENPIRKSVALQSAVKILAVELRVRPWQFAIFRLRNRTMSPMVDRFAPSHLSAID
jgi:hypothetical protein